MPDTGRPDRGRGFPNLVPGSRVRHFDGGTAEYPQQTLGVVYSSGLSERETQPDGFLLNSLPDSTACGSRTVADSLLGGANISVPVDAGMSSKSSSQESLEENCPRHWTFDGVLYAAMTTARLLSPPEQCRELAKSLLCKG